MKTGDTDSIKNLKIKPLATGSAEAASSEGKRSSKVLLRPASVLNNDRINVSNYAELDPSKLKAERQAKVDALKKLIQEGGIQNYLASVPTTQLVQKMSEEVGFVREFVGQDAASE